MREMLRNSVPTLIRDVAFFGLLFVGAEVGLRVIEPTWAMAPSSADATRGNEVRFNRFGLRDDEYVVPKPPGRIRVGVFGNSTTYGVGVAEDDRYTEQLQRLLRERFADEDIEVLNLGELSKGLTRFHGFLSEHGAELELDAVVVGFSPGMLTRSADEHAATVPASKLSRLKTSLKSLPLSVHVSLYKTWTYPTLDGLYRLSLYRMGVLHVPLDKWTGVSLAYAFDVPGNDGSRTEELYAGFASDLSSLNDTVTDEGAQMVVMTIPSQFEISEDPRDNIRNYPTGKIRVDPSLRVAEIGQSLGLAVVDLKAPMVDVRVNGQYNTAISESLYISHDFTHLGIGGHSLAAGILVDAVTPLIERTRSK